MVSPEQLEALDLTLWLGTERLAAEWLNCNQSTVSRRCQDVQRRFAVQRVRDDLSLTWTLQPPSPLLAMERRVHQLHRWLGGGRLRLEVDAELTSLLQPLSCRWISSTSAPLGRDRSLELLRSRVTDGWLSCSSLAFPPAGDPDLRVIDLACRPPRQPPNGNSKPPAPVVLVLSRDLAELPAVQELRQQLGARLQELVAAEPPLELVA